MPNSKLYQEELLDHYKYPRNRGKLENSDIASGILNPSCGDSISIEANIDNNIIINIAFQGHGCVISQAAASMLTERAKNKTLSELLKLNKDDILSMIGIELGPTRLRCALLSLEALQQAIKDYSNQNMSY